MKIKRVYFKSASTVLKHMASVDNSKHKIEFDETAQVFLIDDCVGIPISNVAEFIYEEEVKSLTKSVARKTKKEIENEN